MLHPSHIRTRFLKGRYFLAGVAIAVGYYFVDAMMMTFFFEDGSLWSNIVSPSPDDVWMRSSVAVILIAFGALVQERIYLQHEKRDSLARSLSDSEARLQLILDSIPAAISYVDEKQRFRFANESHRAILDIQPETLIGMTLREAVGKDVYGRAEKHVKRALAGEFVTFESFHAESGPSAMVLSVSYVPHRRQDGKVDGFFAVAYDITKHKETEETLRVAAEDLDQRVAERTAELEKAMASLQKSEELFEVFMSNSREVAGIKDEDGRLLFVNDVYKKSTNTEGEEWRGKTDFDLFPKEIAAQFRQNDLAILKSGKPMIFEEVVLQDGTPQHWLVSKFPIEQPGGKRLLGFNGIDVTERKQAEQALRESEQRFEAFMTYLPAVAFMKDEDGKHLYLNDAQARLLGIEEGSWLGKTDFEMFPAEVAERMRRNDLDVLEKGGAHFFEETTEIDGRRRHWLVSKFVQDDMAGNRLLCGIGIDITERKRAEEELRISEERYRSVIDTTNEGFSRLDKDMRMVEVNDALCQMLGYAREELLGKRPFELVDQASYPGLEARIKKSFSQGVEANNREIRFKRQDGSILVALLSTNILFDEDGNPDGRFTFLTDITQQKERDAQLQQSQKMEAVGQLTGGVAHEFNNLLMVILGNIEVLESRLGKDDPLQLFASSALKGALRGAELTQGLLAFSRKQRLQSGEVDLNGLVLGMQNLFQRTLGETILIDTALDEELWCTSADAGQIEAALLNFVLNARDAMPDGGTITIRTSNREMTADTAAHYDCVGPGDYATLEVRDTGAGMTDEQIEHAFEPFYTTKEVGQGTGLGLSVAYGFAKQSGGCLEIESEPGQGTTARLSLPRCINKEAAAEKQERTHVEPTTGTGTILVVEDDADVRALVVSQLTDLGYDIIEAEDGPAALALLDEYPDIKLLFSDVVLPGGMSGPQAAVQAHHKHPDLKILFTSGYPEKDIEDLDVGGKQVTILGKPYRKTELAEAIANAMKSQ